MRGERPDGRRGVVRGGVVRHHARSLPLGRRRPPPRRDRCRSSGAPDRHRREGRRVWAASGGARTPAAPGGAKPACPVDVPVSRSRSSPTSSPTAPTPARCAWAWCRERAGVAFGRRDDGTGPPRRSPTPTVGSTPAPPRGGSDPATPDEGSPPAAPHPRGGGGAARPLSPDSAGQKLIPATRERRPRVPVSGADAGGGWGRGLTPPGARSAT